MMKLKSGKKTQKKEPNLLNKYMWDDVTGFYYQIDKKDHGFTFKTKMI